MPRDHSRSRSRDRHKSRRDDSRERDRSSRKHSRSHGSSDRRREDRHDAKRSKHRSRSPDRTSQPAEHSELQHQRAQSPVQQLDAEAEKKRLRQEKLAAWKDKQAAVTTAQQPCAAPEPSAAVQSNAAGTAKAAWTPWDDPSIAAATSAPPPAAAPAPAGNASLPPQPPATVDSVMGYARVPQMPKSVAQLRAKFQMEEAQDMLKKQLAQDETEEDPLDAFMSTEILPEVKAKQEAERVRKEEERRQKAALLADGKSLPKEKILVESDSEEETPDEEFDIPAHKVKLMIGAGGEKIKFIQRKTKCRIQVKKDEKELEVGFGQGPTFQLPMRGVQKTEDGAVKTVTVMLFGDRDNRRKARDLIDEALENREQKAQQRHQQAERKREAKARDRQMYHLRHTRDYEALGVPIGSDKATIKKAYRNLAKIWHPDKHPEDQEEAKLKFQEIGRAYESLMTTDEDATILSLGGNTAADRKAAKRQAAAAGVRLRPEAF